MSRIGNKPIAIPAGVEVNVDGNNITVKGPKGTLEYTFRNNVEVKVEDGKIAVTRKDDTKVSKQLHGSTNSNINNMLIGVSEGFKKELEKLQKIAFCEAAITLINNRVDKYDHASVITSNNLIKWLESEANVDESGYEVNEICNDFLEKLSAENKN